VRQILPAMGHTKEIEVYPMNDPVQVLRSRRRTICVEITTNLQVIVRAPLSMDDRDIQAFVAAKSPWIAQHLALAQKRKALLAPPFTREELQALKQAARQDLPRRVDSYARQMGINVGRITIRAQKTRWGSCSAKGNLNFNCLLSLCPEAIRDYVVVHELCHRKELNHSPRFWAEVGRILPDWPARRKWLKTEGMQLIGRLEV
jgi:predicted metal-dependent hydrolase